jgi:heme A synthase
MAELHAVAANAWTQLLSFASGDGLEPWPAEVTPWIESDFPAAARTAYGAARQQQGALGIPAWLDMVHRLAAVTGVAVSLVLLPLAIRRRHLAAGFLAAVLVGLPASALITGGLSTPHDRYQARVMWLPLCVALLAAPALRARANL